MHCFNWQLVANPTRTESYNYEWKSHRRAVFLDHWPLFLLPPAGVFDMSIQDTWTGISMTFCWCKGSTELSLFVLVVLNFEMYHSIISCTDGVWPLYVSQTCNQPLEDLMISMAPSAYFGWRGTTPLLVTVYYCVLLIAEGFIRWNISGYLYSSLRLEWSLTLTTELNRKGLYRGSQ